MKRTLVCLALLAAAAAQAQNQPSDDRAVPAATAHQQKAEIARGAPARWFKEDRTMAAHLSTLRKEITAAEAEALAECRRLPAAERNTCAKDARVTYQKDMAKARSDVM